MSTRYSVTDVVINASMQDDIVLNDLSDIPPVIDIKKDREEDFLNLFSDLNNLRNNKIICENINLNKYNIVKNEQYVDMQHQIMANGYCILFLKNDSINVITLNKEHFIIDTKVVSSKYYSVLLSSYCPRKICINSNSLLGYCNENNIEINGIYDIYFILKILYQVEFNSIGDIACSFYTSLDINEESLLYNLFNLKDKINEILEKNRFMKLINSEHEMINIYSKVKQKGIPINKEDFNNQLDYVNIVRLEASNQLKEQYGFDSEKLSSRNKILRYMSDKGMFQCIDENFLKQENCTLYKYINASNQFRKYSNCKLNIIGDRLIVDYNFYDSNGNITPSFEVDYRYIKSSSKIIIGRYLDLFKRTMIDTVNDKDLITAMNKNIYEEELVRNILDNTHKNKYLASMIFQKILKGEIDDDYEKCSKELLEEYNTMVSPREIEDIVNKLLDKYKNIFLVAANFSKYYSKEKRISFDKKPYLYKYIKTTQADIFKMAIKSIYKCIENFNNTNKFKINIVAFQTDTLILECDNEAVNIAIDILNRKLVEAYSMYNKKVKAVCEVFTVD